jgi:hypothetical protein
MSLGGGKRTDSMFVFDPERTADQFNDADGRLARGARTVVIQLLAAAPPIPSRMVAKTLDLLAPSHLPY